MTRVAFDFDRPSLTALQHVSQRSGPTTLGEGAKECLQTLGVVQEQALAGFDQVFLRNPDTKTRVELKIPSVQRMIALRPWHERCLRRLAIWRNWLLEF